MSAKRTDLGKVQEIHEVIVETKRQIDALGLTREMFLEPSDDAFDFVAEGVMNRVLRVTGKTSRQAVTLPG